MSKGSSNTKEEINVKRTQHLPFRYRVQPFLTPWILMIVVFVAAAITHQFLSGPLALFFLSLWAVGITVVTWKTWSDRHEHARVAATGFAGGMGLWLLLATAAGPVWQPMIYLFVIGGSFLSLTWNIRYAAITPTNKHDKLKTGPVDSISEVKGLKNTVTSKVKRIADKSGDRVEIMLTHPGGKNTTGDVRKRKDNIAGLHSVDPETVRISEVPGRGDKTKVTIRPVNPTTDVIPYPGPSRPGQSITAGPLVTGVREDGAPSAHWITGSDEESRAASASVYSGMTGSGKTKAYILSLLEQVSRTDCAVPVLGDSEKFSMSFGMIMDYIPCAADGPDQVDQLISNLPEAMRYRAALLGSLGYYDGWVPQCWTEHRIPVQPVHIEEAGGYLNNQDFFKAMTLCRALGMPISISLQVAKYNQLPTESRGQFGNSFAFGVKKIAEAAFVLTAETIRAGGDPSRWANNYPGRNIAEVTGVPSDEWSMTHRAFKVTTPEIVETFDECRRSGIAVCDEGTFERLSRGIVRPQRMIVGVPDWKSVDTTPTVPLPVDHVPAPVLRMVKDPEPVPAPAVPDDENMHQMISDRIDELEMSGVTELTKDDFADLPLGDLHRTWIFQAMKRQVKTGRLRRLPGKEARYEIIPVADRQEG